MKEFIIQYWKQILFGAIAAGLGISYKRLTSYQKGMRASLRHNIIQEYEKYTAREEIPLYGMENVTEMYDAYHALGGNGAITKLVDELRELPTKKKG